MLKQERKRLFLDRDFRVSQSIMVGEEGKGSLSKGHVAEILTMVVDQDTKGRDTGS